MRRALSIVGLAVLLGAGLTLVRPAVTTAAPSQLSPTYVPALSHRLTRANMTVYAHGVADVDNVDVGGTVDQQSVSAEVLAIVDFVSAHRGGEGAVRDLIEMVLRAQGLWESIVGAYSAEGKP